MDKPGIASREKHFDLSRFSSTAESFRSQLPAVGSFLLPFALVLGLSLEFGGYDMITRSQFGIVAWWVILLCVAFGIVPVIRVTSWGWLMMGLLAGLAGWTALATLTWTQSTERSVIEMSRTVALLGFLFILLLFQGREGMRRQIGGLGAAVAVVAAVAICSRYHPSWFDIGTMPEGYPVARLSYPLGYWNGLGALMAIGLPALIWLATEARNKVFRGLAAAAIPLLVLAAFMTASRGGIGALVVSFVLLVVIYPRRLAMLASLVVPVAASALLIWLLTRNPELRDNLGGEAGPQGVRMTWITIGVFAATAGAAWLIQARLLGSRLRIPEIKPSVTWKVGYVAAGVGVAICLVAVASGTLADRWREFKEPVTTDPTVSRLASLSSGERYENWRTALEAGEDHPLTGAGPGTFEYLWARNGDGSIFVRDAHSFYLESFAELGVPGFLLALAVVLVPIGIAVFGATRRRLGERRPLFAVAAAGMTAFATSAAVDWSWEMTVLVAAFLAYVAIVCGPDAETRSGRANGRTFRLPLLDHSRLAIMVGAVVAIAVIYVPMEGTSLVRESQALYRAGDMSSSLAKANDARDVNPWSASAAIQVALLESEIGNSPDALDASSDAVDLDPYNWKAWQVYARMAELDGQTEVAREASEKAAELNNRYQADPAQ